LARINIQKEAAIICCYIVVYNRDISHLAHCFTIYRNKMGIFIYILFIANTITLVFSRRDIRYELTYNNKVFDNYFMLFPIPSGLQCAIMCYQQPTCSYFSFNTHQKLCMFHSEQIYIKKLAYTMDEKWNIYGLTAIGMIFLHFCRKRLNYVTLYYITVNSFLFVVYQFPWIVPIH